MLRKQWIVEDGEVGMKVPFCSACYQYDALGRWWDTVSSLGLLIRLTMGGDDGAERFCGVKPG